MKKMTIGVDEVGRGPGAGPIMACAFLFIESPSDIALKDSKELTAKSREKIFEQLSTLRKEGKANWSVISIPPETIDQEGIQKSNISAIRLSVKSLLDRMASCATDSIEIIVDGNLNINPIVYNEQEIQLKSIVKADKDFSCVSAASIVAKVIRDRYMDLLHKKHPQYFWSKNKGYLTRDHCDAIAKYGLSIFHRKSFCKGMLSGQ